MLFRSLLAASALAGALSLAATTADAARATADLSVRSGPGTNYARVDVIPQGRFVNIGRCSGNWCQVRWPGRDGWASASYLAGGGPAPRRGYYRPRYRRAPGLNFDFGDVELYLGPDRPRYWYDRRYW